MKKTETRKRLSSAKLRDLVAFWFVMLAMVLMGFVFAEMCMNFDVADWFFYVLYASTIPTFVWAFKGAYHKGFWRTVLLPIISAFDIVILLALGVRIHAVYRSLDTVISTLMLVDFAPYWAIPSGLGIILGSAFGKIRRK